MFSSFEQENTIKVKEKFKKEEKFYKARPIIKIKHILVVFALCFVISVSHEFCVFGSFWFCDI